MKFHKLALVLTVFGTLGVSQALYAASVGDFALLDTGGKYHQLSYYGDQQAVVIYAHRNGSAQVKKDLQTLAALRQEGVVVLMLNADNERDAISQDAQSLGTDIPILFDEGKVVARALGLDRIGEVLVVDPAGMQITYSGTVAGAAQTLAGADIAATEVQGDAIQFPSSQQVSYTDDIVPILQENCVSCHHEGGIGPWAMNSHTMVMGFAPMIKEVVMTRRMPPGQIDEHVSKPILNSAGLTLAQREQLIQWIDAGAPKDGTSDPLAELTFSNAKFSMGEPDLVYTVPAQAIPATGIIDYRYVPLELDLDKDVWVSAMEFVPGDKEVLHHVIAYVSSPADKSVRGRETGAAQGESVGGFAPGRSGERFRDNSGRLIRKGSNLLLQMHYTTSGRETVDETQVGIFIHDKPPTYVMRGGVAGQRRFLVPPGAKEHVLSGEELIEGDAYLYAMMPHMHYRGKRMSYSAIYPDGTKEMLLSVPKYDFNWQFSYELAEPVFLPAGTRLVADGAMDNSAQNPGNPDPTKPVHFGLQTKHEMFFGFTTIRYVGDTPDKLVAEKAEKAAKQTQDAAGR